MQQQRLWWKPALVLLIDLLWSLVLEQIGRPLFVGLYPGQEAHVNQLLDEQLMPMLWLSYAIVMSAQLGWLTWAARQQRRWHDIVSIESQLRRLRRAWWICALGQLALALGVQRALAAGLGAIDPAGLGLVVVLLLCDLLVIFWLPTALLVPKDLRNAVPLLGRWPRT